MKRDAFAAGSTGWCVLIAISSRSIWPTIQDLGDVEILELDLCPACDALLVHQAGHIRRDHVFSPVAELVLNLVESHPSGYGLVRHAKRAAKSTTFIGPVQRHQHQSLDLREQRLSLVERRTHDLRRSGQSETSHRAAAIVNRNRVWELRPGK